jgi:hypothetical protein
MMDSRVCCWPDANLKAEDSLAPFFDALNDTPTEHTMAYLHQCQSQHRPHVMADEKEQSLDH